MVTRYYREKSIPMTALWCPAFSNHFIMPETQQPIYTKYRCLSVTNSPATRPAGKKIIDHTHPS